MLRASPRSAAVCVIQRGSLRKPHFNRREERIEVTDRTGSRKPHALIAEMGITEQEIARRKAWLQFLDEDVARLQGLDRLARRWAHSVIEDLYAHMFEFDEARAFFSDPAVLARAKHAQKEYFARLTEGRYGTEYVEDRLNIGAVHERIGLSVQWYLGAYNFHLRNVGARVFDALRKNPKAALAAFLSLTKLAFLDMGLAIDSYIFRREQTIRGQALALAEREDLFRGVFDRSHDAILIIDPVQDRILDANPSACRLLEYGREELLSTPVSAIHKDEMPRLQVFAAVVTKRGFGWTDELTCRTKTGLVVPSEIAASPIDVAGGSYILAIVRDITERKHALELAQQYAGRLRVLHEIDKAILAAGAPEEIGGVALRRLRQLVPCRHASLIELDSGAREAAVVAVDVDDRTELGAGQRFPLDASSPRDEALRRGLVYETDDTRASARPSSIEQILQAEGVRSITTVPLVASGKLIGALNLGRDMPGALAPEYVGFARDVAESLAVAIQQERLRQELRDALDARRGLFEGVPVGLYRTTPEGRMLDANPALVQILGYPDRNSLMAANMAELYVDPEARTRWMALMERDNTVSDFETQVRKRDGSVIWVKDDARIVRDVRGQVSHYDGVMTDITDRRRADEQIQRQLRQLQALRDVDVAIGGSLDLSVVLDVLVEKVIGELGVDATDVLLFNSPTQTFGYAAGRGFRTAALKHTHLSLGEGYAGRAALERRVVDVPNLAEAPGGFVRAPLFKAEGFSTYYAAPLIAKGQVKGVLEVFHRSPPTPAFDRLDLLDAFARQAAIAIDNAELFAGLQRSKAELALAYDTTIEGWSHALDLRDKETEGHTQRVMETTLRLARALGVPEADFEHIRRGALLHDIGKMGLPDSILLKPGPLTPEELAIMRRHPEYAFTLLSPILYLRPALDIPYCHHEKWDGTGYPRGLRGEQIPLAARIFAVVDVWDALRSDRPYRAAWPEDRARDHIREQAGKHFEPRVVEVFLSMEP